MEINADERHQMHDRVVKIENDATKFILSLHQKQSKHVAFSFFHHFRAISHFVNFYDNPHPEEINYYVHFLAKFPCNISSRNKIDESINVNRPSWISYWTNVAKKFCIIGTVWVIKIMIGLLNIRLHINVIGTTNKCEN
jgi:hypothetical protein